MVRCWKVAPITSVFKELGVSGGDITGSTAALSVTQADDWTHHKRASASPAIPTASGPRASVSLSAVPSLSPRSYISPPVQGQTAPLHPP